MKFRQPIDKVLRIQKLLVFLMSRTKVCLKILQSLLGLLAFASKMMPTDRVFAKRLYCIISGCSTPSHFVHITSDIVEDLLVWRRFLHTYSIMVVLYGNFLSVRYICILMLLGHMGAFWNGHWSASAWHYTWKSRGLMTNILLLELFPVIEVLELWGSHLDNRQILLHSDNKCIVFAINCHQNHYLLFLFYGRLYFGVCCLIFG